MQRERKPIRCSLEGVCLCHMCTAMSRHSTAALPSLILWQSQPSAAGNGKVSSQSQEGVRREARQWREAQMEKVAGYKCSDSLRAEVSDLDFPSKQCRQSSEMTIRKERAAQLCDCMSWGTATPVAHLLQRVQVAPGITDKPWHAQGCPAAAMPCREWKHFATAAAACSFPLDATSLIREQMPTAWGCGA